jgi:hypothetical protein
MGDMFRTFQAAALAALLVSGNASAASRQWQTGTLAEMEQQKVKSGSTTFRHADGEAKDHDGKAKYSGDSTETKSDDIDTYEVYTIETPDKTYVAREKLYFPWSKPASVNVGDSLKFAVEGGKLYILGEDQKEHKTSVSKVSLTRK